MSTNRKLFQNFNPVSKQEWIDKVKVDLKGEDFERKLVWRNLNQLNFQPFYTTEDRIDFLSNTGENSQDLVNYRSIEVASPNTANQKAQKAIEEGITGIIFELNEAVSVEMLLKGINLDRVAVSFVLKADVENFANAFFAYAENHISNMENLKGYFDLGFLSDYVTKGNLELNQFDLQGNLVKLSESYPNFKAFTISGVPFLDSGSNQVQETAYTLNALVYAVEQLLERGLKAKAIFDNIHVQLAIGSEYFIEIGKFRAFHSLLSLVAKKYDVVKANSVLTAKTAVWSKSVTDAHTNMLRTTTEAMAAILGNVNGVLVDPYDREFKNTSDFSSRIAGNISTILKEESYFGKVGNPVDGSYYIEEVTAKIAEKALDLFKTIEQAGGFYEAFENETIQQQIAQIRQEKIKLISQRRLPMVGVNKYPNLMEKVPTEVLSEGKTSNSKVLTPRRASLEVEAIRKITEQLVEETGSRPIIELTSFGNLTMRKARAAFSYDFLGVSGFEVWQEKSFNSVEDAAINSAVSKSDVVVICSSDQDYQESALAFVEAFRKNNTDKVLLLAGNPIDIVDSLNQAGLDGCIHIKSDVIQTISAIQNKVQNKFKSLEV